MKYIIFFLPVFFLIACSANSEKENNNNSKENLVHYAQFFKIIRNGSSTEIQIFSPDTKQLEQTWRIEEKSPLTKIACLSSTHIGMLSKLQLIDKIGAISNRLYVDNNILINRLDQGKVIELGEEMQIPIENLVNSNCQAIFYSGFGKSFPHASTLNKLGISCVVNYDWRELHPLGKAEWILLFGYLMGEQEKAHSIFNALKEKYEMLVKKNKASISLKQSVISGNMWGDQWNAPAGESFGAKLISDAGGEYIYSQTAGTGSVQYSLEKIVEDTKNTAFWINTGMPTKDMIRKSNPKIAYTNLYKFAKIYDYSKSGNRFWEMSAIEPDKVLEDYIHIFNQTKLDQLNFYHQLK